VVVVVVVVDSERRAYREGLAVDVVYVMASARLFSRCA